MIKERALAGPGGQTFGESVEQIGEYGYRSGWANVAGGLLFRQKHLCHHATGATATIGFDSIDRAVQELGVTFEGFYLGWLE